MLLDHGPLGGAQRPTAGQERLRGPHLADVVQASPQLERLALRGRESEPSAQLQRGGAQGQDQTIVVHALAHRRPVVPHGEALARKVHRLHLHLAELDAPSPAQRADRVQDVAALHRARRGLGEHGREEEELRLLTRVMWTGSWPAQRRANSSAAVTPPKPPPTMTTRGASEVEGRARMRPTDRFDSPSARMGRDATSFRLRRSRQRFAQRLAYRRDFTFL